MLDQGEGNTYACCSENQLSSLDASLVLSKAVLLRCPACADNFAHLHCTTTCSPNQSQILNITRTMNVTQTVTTPSGNGTVQVNQTKTAVVAYQAFISTDFADGAFGSCQNVRIPATGGYAISTMCGRYGAKLCTPQRWYDFQGDSSNGLAPLDIDFNLMSEGDTEGVPEGVVPYNGRALMCNESTQTSDDACSCQDCKERCPIIVIPPPDAPFELLGADGFLVVSIILLCLLVVAFLLYLFATCYVRSRKRKDVEKGKKKGKGKDQNSNTVTQRVIDPSEVTCAERNSMAAQAFLSRKFQCWGTLMATYPLTVSSQ